MGGGGFGDWLKKGRREWGIDYFFVSIFIMTFHNDNDNNNNNNNNNNNSDNNKPFLLRVAFNISR